MVFKEYMDGLRQSYEGELVGERLYRMLSKRSADEGHRVRLAAIADVELSTSRVLSPIAARLKIVPDETAMRYRIEHRFLHMERLSWDAFIESALVDWPPYIEAFDALRRMAPSLDAPALTIVVRHEHVLVEFARLEHDEPGSLRALDLLRFFVTDAMQ